MLQRLFLLLLLVVVVVVVVVVVIVVVVVVYQFRNIRGGRPEPQKSETP